MEKLLKGRHDPSLVGLLQALGVVVYCALVGGFFTIADRCFSQPGFLGIVLMLVLLVFSAAVTGSLVFGCPAYLVLNKKIKEALAVLAYTLLYSVGIILIILLAIIFLAQ